MHPAHLGYSLGKGQIQSQRLQAQSCRQASSRASSEGFLVFTGGQTSLYGHTFQFWLAVSPKPHHFLLALLISMCPSSPEKPLVDRVLVAAGWVRKLSVHPGPYLSSSAGCWLSGRSWWGAGASLGDLPCPHPIPSSLLLPSTF